MKQYTIVIETKTNQKKINNIVLESHTFGKYVLPRCFDTMKFCQWPLLKNAEHEKFAAKSERIFHDKDIN